MFFFLFQPNEIFICTFQFDLLKQLIKISLASDNQAKITFFSSLAFQKKKRSKTKRIANFEMVLIGVKLLQTVSLEVPHNSFALFCFVFFFHLFSLKKKSKWYIFSSLFSAVEPWNHRGPASLFYDEQGIKNLKHYWKVF